MRTALTSLTLAGLIATGAVGGRIMIDSRTASAAASGFDVRGKPGEVGPPVQVQTWP